MRRGGGGKEGNEERGRGKEGNEERGRGERRK